MKTKFGFIQAFKSIMFNERGSIGAEEDSGAEIDDVAESSDEGAEEIQEEESSEEPSEDESEESSEDFDEDSDVEVQAESEEEFQEEVEEAIEKGASEEEVKSMIRKFNLKVDGKEIEKEIDLNDEEALKREFQLAAKGQKSMQEKAEQEKAFAQFLQAARKDPFKAMKQLDPSFDEMEYVAKIVDEMVKEQEMTPEQKEQAKMRKEYEEALAERDRLRKEAQERQAQEQTQQILNQLKQDIETALNADEDLVADKSTVALVAQEMARADEQGVELNANQALQIAKRRLQQQYESSANMFKSTASMKKYVGNNLLEKLREDRANLAKKQQEVKGTSGIKNVSRNAPAKKAPEKKISLSDLMAGRVNFDE